eukprot:11181693-Lingulodinium_polyedra.AAC.1
MTLATHEQPWRGRSGCLRGDSCEEPDPSEPEDLGGGGPVDSFSGGGRVSAFAEPLGFLCGSPV